MRHLFLINPHAGKYDRTQEMREKLRTALAGRDEPWEAAVTQYPGHGAELARAAAERGEPVRIYACLLYTSPSPRDQRGSRMPSSA